VAAALLTSIGCYSLQPVAGQPLPLGTVVSLGISDAGRVAIGGQMGQEISEVEGRLLQRDSSHYELSVQQVRFIRGGEQVWSGEHISIATEHVTTVAERKFSRGRTVLLSTATIGVVALAVSKSLLGSLILDEDRTPPDSGITIRYPRFGRH
jgi:hypothetical protein